MGIFGKHTPAPIRDPRPKGTNWKVGNGKMAYKMATNKDVRKAEREGRGKK